MAGILRFKTARLILGGKYAAQSPLAMGYLIQLNFSTTATLGREESGRCREVAFGEGSTLHIVERKFMSVICSRFLLKPALNT